MADYNRFERLKNILADGGTVSRNTITPQDDILNTLGAAMRKRRHRKRHGARPPMMYPSGMKPPTALHPHGKPGNTMTPSSHTPPGVSRGHKPGWLLEFKRRTAGMSATKVASLLAKFKLRMAAKKAQKAKVNQTVQAMEKQAMMAKLKAAVVANPATRKRLRRSWLRRRLVTTAQGRPGATSPSRFDEMPSPTNKPSPLPVTEPQTPAIDYDHTPTQEEVTEEDINTDTADRVQSDQEARQEAVDEGEDEAEDENQAEEDENEELTEATSDEEAEDEADSAVEDDNSAGASIASVMGRKIRKAKRKAKRTRIHAHAVPIAKGIERKSKGKVKAKKVLAGCALLQSAKAGNPKAKASVKKLEAAAKKGNPKAKKAVLQLKLCNKVLKKARKAANRATPMRGIPPDGPGLTSKSAYRRGAAMIPAVSRAMFRA